LRAPIVGGPRLSAGWGRTAALLAFPLHGLRDPARPRPPPPRRAGSCPDGSDRRVHGAGTGPLV